MWQLDRVVDLIEPLTESPMETRLRMLFVFAGLTGFEPQFEVTDARRRFLGRVDFAFVAQRLIVEYDGSHHWEQRRADDRRREAIRNLG
jgi:very-short-patch-repair endonuclease